MAAYYGNNDIVDEIKSRLDIIDVISETVSLTRKGNRYWGKCPFHQEKTPSFCVTPEKNMYYCFGCHAGGDMFSFVMRRDGVDFKEALEILAVKAGLNFSAARFDNKTYDLKRNILDINKKAALFYQDMLKSPEGKEAREYLKKRGITEETAALFSLGYAPNEWERLKEFLLSQGIAHEHIIKSGLLKKSEKTGSYFDLFRNRIIFPIFKYNGDIIAFGGRVLDDSLPKYLNSPETEIFSKRHNLYGLFQAREAIREANEVILVEGYIDCMKLHQAGIKNVVASLGTAFTIEQANLLCRYAEKVVILYDGDEAGQNSAVKAIDILSSVNMQIYVVSIPSGHDPDEYLDLLGKEDFLTFIQNNKISYIEFKINRYISRRKAIYLEDKIEIINKVKPDIIRLESEITKDYYIKLLSRKLMLEENIVYKEINNKNTRKSASAENKTITKRDNIRYGNYTLEDKLMASMLKNDNIFNRIKTTVGFDIFTNKAYRQICAIYDGLDENEEGKIKQLEKILLDEELMSHYARVAFINQKKDLLDEIQVEKVIRHVMQRKQEIAWQMLFEKINILKDKGDFNEVLKFLVYLDSFLNNTQEGGIR